MQTHNSDHVDRMPGAAFPLIDSEAFYQSPKSRKRRDLERILYSGNSEDWVTWTVFRLLQSSAAASWWTDLLGLARAENPNLVLPSGWDETPKVRLWEPVSSPCGYESASRERMRTSENKAWVERSRIGKPVEGDSEIDVVLENKALLIFAEAKLGSDISLDTKYDPRRDQITRNIDCVLDQAKDRVPMFWLIYRDAGEERSYMQLLHRYRAHPGILEKELPHHVADAVRQVAGNLTLLLWKDIVCKVIDLAGSRDKQIVAITEELSRRIPR
jgi:hypothetical protein